MDALSDMLIALPSLRGERLGRLDGPAEGVSRGFFGRLCEGFNG